MDPILQAERFFDALGLGRNSPNYTLSLACQWEKSVISGYGLERKQVRKYTSKYQA